VVSWPSGPGDYPRRHHRGLKDAVYLHAPEGRRDHTTPAEALTSMASAKTQTDNSGTRWSPVLRRTGTAITPHVTPAWLYWFAVEQGDMRMPGASNEVPLLVEVAINGRCTKERNPSAPIAPPEIAEEAIRCFRNGAAIVHQHDAALMAGGGAAEMASQAAESYRAIYQVFPDALCYPTIAGTSGAITERWGHNLILADQGLLRMSFVDPGSTNYVELAPDGLPADTDGRYSYSNADIRWILQQCHERQLAANVMVLDGGFLRMVLEVDRAGQMPSGSMVKLAFGGDGAAKKLGLPPTLPSLLCYIDMLSGSDLPWMTTVYGGDCVETGLAEYAIRNGGHVRVGLEDYLGPRTPTNLELLEEVTNLATKFGRSVATPTEASEMLGLGSR
jgi:3-keto-5-aminohexanoate cleavage enzyme